MTIDDLGRWQLRGTVVEGPTCPAEETPHMRWPEHTPTYWTMHAHWIAPRVDMDALMSRIASATIASNT